MKELINQHVIAICSCGIKKGQEVFGILSENKGKLIVTVIDEDGFESLYEVNHQTVREA
jgi:hypothetical protein